MPTFTLGATPPPPLEVRDGGSVTVRWNRECYDDDSSVASGDEVRQPKPAAEGLETALRKLGVAAHEAVYIGDTEVDYEMAANARVRFLGVTSQFSTSSFAVVYQQVATVGQIKSLFNAAQVDPLVALRCD